MLESLFGQSQANEPASVLRHEIDCFGRDLFRRQHQIAFVFAVLIVHDDDHSSLADFVQSGGDISEWRVRLHL